MAHLDLLENLDQPECKERGVYLANQVIEDFLGMLERMVLQVTQVCPETRVIQGPLVVEDSQAKEDCKVQGDLTGRKVKRVPLDHLGYRVKKEHPAMMALLDHLVHLAGQVQQGS